jgi:hypothetical protein
MRLAGSVANEGSRDEADTRWQAQGRGRGIKSQDFVPYVTEYGLFEQLGWLIVRQAREAGERCKLRGLVHPLAGAAQGHAAQPHQARPSNAGGGSSAEVPSRAWIRVSRLRKPREVTRFHLGRAWVRLVLMAPSRLPRAQYPSPLRGPLPHRGNPVKSPLERGGAQRRGVSPADFATSSNYTRHAGAGGRIVEYLFPSCHPWSSNPGFRFSVQRSAFDVRSGQSTCLAPDLADRSANAGSPAPPVLLHAPGR